MLVNFELDLKRVLVLEGGYVNNPNDPGGPTNFGVTQHVYDGYRHGLNQVPLSVHAITHAEVAAIYRLQYANKVRYDDLPAGVDGLLFDGAVNSGPGQSVKWLQRALGNVRVDGSIGAATLDAVNAIEDHDLLIARICERRMAFLKALTTYKTFGKGWANRVNHVKDAAQLVARGSVGPEPVYFMGGEKRAYIEYAKPMPSKAIPDAFSGGGAVTLGLNGAQTALANLSFIPHIDNAIGVLAAAGGAALGIGVLGRWYYKRQENALVDALDLRPPAEFAAAGAPVAA